MTMKFYYGISSNKFDITSFVENNCIKDNVCYIPQSSAKRTLLFGDPIIGIHKFIFVLFHDVETVYDEYTHISIDINTGEHVISVDDKLNLLHNNLELWFGSFKDELPEQYMLVSNLKGDEKVLEIGANIGRSSLIIASCLKDQNNFVSMECDTYTSKQLTINRDWNKMYFKIENSALSEKKICQKGWDTVCLDNGDHLLSEGYKEVKTITLKQLNDKYKIDFDTLFLDCEGAFYYILRDTPEILNGINLIIMENDYHNIVHKMYIDNIMREQKFECIYSESGGWGVCKEFFFQVWKK